MNICYITFRSVTPAQRAERILRSFGVVCTVVRTPKWMEEQGCGYSLRVPQKFLNQSKKILDEKNIPYRKIYLRLDNGNMEEIFL